MGHNDHTDDPVDLPVEAGQTTDGGFEPDDKWLRGANEELQVEVMRRWFLTRYEDPGNEMPYDGEDGCFIFPWGGPYDPSDVLRERFEQIVSDGVIEKLVTYLISEVGNEWAPILPEVDYDEELSFTATDRNDPFRLLIQRLGQVEAIVLVSIANPQSSPLLLQMAHSSLIAMLEAYLADTAVYWVTNDQEALKQFVSTNKDFKSRQLNLNELFTRLNNLNDEVVDYLQGCVWHRLDKVVPMLEEGLKINIPPIADLMKQIVVRHDIMHRAGVTREGESVMVQVEDVRGLRETLRTFAEKIESALKERFPDGAAKEEFPF